MLIYSFNNFAFIFFLLQLIKLLKRQCFIAEIITLIQNILEMHHRSKFWFCCRIGPICFELAFNDYFTHSILFFLKFFYITKIRKIHTPISLSLSSIYFNTEKYHHQHKLPTTSAPPFSSDHRQRQPFVFRRTTTGYPNPLTVSSELLT